MKISTLLLPFALSLVAGGCIDVKDVGVGSDASSGGATSEGSGESVTSGASASASATTASSDTLTASGTATTTAETTATQGATETTGQETMTSGETDTFGATDSSTGTDTDDSEPQQRCEDSGGIWDVTSCGHYTCGLPPECAAVVPGCDCGVGSTFVEGPGGGCEPSEACETVAFSCGPELTCSAPSEFCDVLIPGVKGAETSYDCLETPDSCSDAYTCGCIGGAGDCEKGPEGGLTVTIAAP